MATYRVHKDLQGIPSEYFVLWGETLGYERGLPHFRQLPEFAEEGVLIPSAEGYTYWPIHRLVAPHMQTSSQLSPSLTGQVELEDSSSQMSLPPSQNPYEMPASSYPTLCQQTPWPSAPSTSSQIHDDQPSGEDSSYDVDFPFNSNSPHPETFYQSPNYVYANTEPSTMAEIEQTHPRAISTPDSTRDPHNTQCNSRDPVSPYAEVQSLGHDGLASHQLDIQMAEIFDLVPFITPPYGTNNTGGTFGTYNASLQ